ncbi:hypothetical protein SBDP1_1040048 [Syntrophobacter sp. SbD1]|nr:hypothetical protein SBDP1_1040048 [Syntrophobacter sp. SbD1]
MFVLLAPGEGSAFCGTVVSVSAALFDSEEFGSEEFDSEESRGREFEKKEGSCMKMKPAASRRMAGKMTFFL